MTGLEFIDTILNWAWLAIAGLIGWVGKMLWKKNEEMNALMNRVSLLEDNQVKEDKIKILFKDMLESYLQDQQEIKKDMRTIADTVVQLRIDFAAANAVRGQKDGRKE